jgi:hypothetical protein
VVVTETEDHEHQHHATGHEGGDGGQTGDPSDGRPGVGGQEQAAQGLTLEEGVALPRDGGGVGLELGERRLIGTFGLGGRDGCGGLALGVPRSA